MARLLLCALLAASGCSLLVGSDEGGDDGGSDPPVDAGPDIFCNSTLSLVDDFSSVDNQWRLQTRGLGTLPAAIAGGLATFSYSIEDTAEFKASSVTSRGAYDLTGSSISVRVDEVSSPFSPFLEIRRVPGDDFTASTGFVIDVAGSEIVAMSEDNVVLGRTPFPGPGTTLHLREQDGRLLYEVGGPDDPEPSTVASDSQPAFPLTVVHTAFGIELDGVVESDGTALFSGWNAGAMVASVCPFFSLSDDFDDGLSSLWNPRTHNLCEIERRVDQDDLVIRSRGASCNLFAAHPYDLTGQEIVLFVGSPPSLGESTLSLSLASTEGVELLMDQNGDQLSVTWADGDSGGGANILTNPLPDSQYWRIRELDGTVTVSVHATDGSKAVSHDFFQVDEGEIDLTRLMLRVGVDTSATVDFAAIAAVNDELPASFED